MAHSLLLAILLVGGIIVLTMLVRYGSEKIGLPALIGYFILGILLRAAHSSWGLLSEGGLHIFEFLASLGIIALLFRVGLESDMASLMERLPQASLLWIANILVSGALGYWVAHHLLGWALIPSLFVAVALTATSVGISVAVWQEAGALNTSNGALMLDVAELDDLSGIVLMALLFAVAPLLKEQAGASLLPVLTQTLGLLLLKLAAFMVLCVLFARYMERPITRLFEAFHDGKGTMLVVLGIGIMVAALAGLIGFSVAIGAFFAGLIFSRDPDSVKFDASFGSLHDLFAPFFFIGIGLAMDPGALTSALVPATALILAAVIGKILGTAVPALATMGVASAVVLGVSMVPRAEIALIIMQQGLELGDWAVPPDVFANLAVMAAVTAVFVPVILRPMFKRWPQT